MKYKAIFNVVFVVFAFLILGASFRHDQLQKNNNKTKLNDLVTNENETLVSAMNGTTEESEVLNISDSSVKSSSDSNSDSTISDSKSKTKSNSDTTNSDSNNTSDSNLPEYTKKYPDMYVKSDVVDNLEDGKKVAYLTFDDGPSHVTGEVLDILYKYDVKATFFILGSTMTDDGKEYLKLMSERGHAIGIHTYSHKNDIYKSVDAFLDDFYKAFTLVYEITGEKPTIFRFPYGSINCYSDKIKYELIGEMERRGFIYYDWNVCANDSIGNPSEGSIINNVSKNLCKYCKPVILLHDASVNELTAKALPKIIEKIQEEGYEFDTVNNRTPCQFYYKHSYNNSEE